MFVQAYDADSLVKVAIYAGHISSSEYERSVACALEMARDTLQRPTAMARVLVIVETPEVPPARFRRDLAEADKQMPRCDFAFVTQSAVARAAMTVFNWISPEREGRRRQVFSRFDEARTWLVAGGARESLIDLLYSRARAELGGSGARPVGNVERRGGRRTPC